jgi:hypothetical protein
LFHELNIRKEVIHVAKDRWVNAEEERPVIEARYMSTTGKTTTITATATATPSGMSALSVVAGVAFAVRACSLVVS